SPRLQHYANASLTLGSSASSGAIKRKRRLRSTRTGFFRLQGVSWLRRRAGQAVLAHLLQKSPETFCKRWTPQIGRWINSLPRKEQTEMSPAKGRPRKGELIETTAGYCARITVLVDGVSVRKRV